MTRGGGGGSGGGSGGGGGGGSGGGGGGGGGVGAGGGGRGGAPRLRTRRRPRGGGSGGGGGSAGGGAAGGSGGAPAAPATQAQSATGGAAAVGGSGGGGGTSKRVGRGGIVRGSSRAGVGGGAGGSGVGGGAGGGADGGAGGGRGGRSAGSTKVARARADAEARERARVKAAAEAEAAKAAEVEAAKARREEARRKAEAAAAAAKEAEAAERAAAERTARAAAATAAREKAARREAERRRNVGFSPDSRPSEAELRRLESSLKKCSGFVRRLGGGDGPVLADEALLRECRALNLTRYISEVVAAIADARVRSSETEAAARLCGELHRRYADFAEQLCGALVGAVGDTKKEIVSRRTAVRMLVELVAVGIADDSGAVFSAVKEAMKSGRGASDEELANMSIVASFAKVGGRIFLSTDRSRSEDASSAGTAFGAGCDDALNDDASAVANDTAAATSATAEGVAADGNAAGDAGDADEEDHLAWEDVVLSNDQKVVMTTIMQGYLREVLSLLTTAGTDLQAADTAVLVARLTRGIEDEGALAEAATIRKYEERFYAAAVAVSEALNRTPPPPYIFQAESGLASAGAGRDGARIVVGSFGGGPRAGRGGASGEMEAEEPEEVLLFDDEQDFAFYRELPELDNGSERPEEDAGNVVMASTDQEEGDTPVTGPCAIDKGGETLTAESDVVPETFTALSSVAASPSETASAAKSTSAAATGPDVAQVAAPAPAPAPAQVLAPAPAGSENTMTLDNLLSRLPMVDSLDTTNAFVAHFCVVATRNRASVKRLTKGLAQVTSKMLNVLPAYARIAASLQPRYPDIASTVAATADEDMRAQIARTDHDEKSTANYIKTARYVGELIKFELLPANTLFDLLALCIKDFVGHKVEIACHLLETCGRYLHRSPMTSVRTGNVLDTLWRLKSVKNLEARHNALVETAYYVSRPRGMQRFVVKKRRDALREYIRWRIYAQLCDSNVEWTVKHLRKLPWDDELERYVVRKFLNVTCMRYSMYPCAAKLLAGLASDRSSLGVSVCDGLLEAILVGLERNDGRDSQRRVAEVVLLGELFNSGLVGPVTAYEQLYQLITYGHEASSAREKWRVATGGLPMSNGLAPGIVDAGADSLAPAPGSFAMSSRGGRQVSADLAGDFFRVRLACTLLDACGTRLAMLSSKSTSRQVQAARRQMEIYWVYFERYMLIKTAQAGLGNRLPLHMEHMVVDTFEKVIRPLRCGLALTDLRHKIKSRGFKSFPQGCPPEVYPVSAARSASDKNAQVTSSRATTACSESDSGAAVLKRVATLEAAVEAVQRVESTPSDLALICMPNRKYTPCSKESNGEENADVSRDGVATAAVVATVADGVDGDVGSETESSCSSSEESDGAEEDVEGPNCDFSDSESAAAAVSMAEADSDAAVDDGGSSMNDDEDPFSSSSSASNSSSNDDEEEEEEEDDFEIASTPKVKTEEEDDFEKELTAFMSAEANNAKQAFTGHTTLDRMAIPIGLMAKHKETERAAAVDAALSGSVASGDNAVQAANEASVSTSVPAGASSESSHHGNAETRARNSSPSTVAFKMLVRRGGKSQMRELAVPSASSLAVATKESESVGAAAHEELKRLVLGSRTVVQGGEEEEDDDGTSGLAGAHEHMFNPAAATKRKEQSISERRAADEQALLSSLFRAKPRR